MRVAVTGMNARPDNPGPGYAVARCLRESPDFDGHIVGLGYDVLDAGVYHFDAGYLLPYPATGEAAMLERLLCIHARERLDALIPCLDAELPLMIAIAPELEKHGIKTFLPAADTLKARNKERLPELCARARIPTPETRTLSGPEFFSRCEEEGWAFPLVVKGCFYDAEIVATPEAGRRAFHRLAREWGFPVLAQRYCQGEEFNLTGIGDGHQLQAPVMMRKRALTEKGKGWAGVSVVDEQLERMGAALVQTLGWRGPLEVEALKTSDGRFHLIEINPRFPAWIYLSQGVGRNLPGLLLRLLRGEPLPPLPPLQPGMLFIRYAEEIILDLPTYENILMMGTRSQICH